MTPISSGFLPAHPVLMIPVWSYPVGGGPRSGWESGRLTAGLRSTPCPPASGWSMPTTAAGLAPVRWWPRCIALIHRSQRHLPHQCRQLSPLGAVVVVCAAPSRVCWRFCEGCGAALRASFALPPVGRALAGAGQPGPRIFWRQATNPFSGAFLEFPLLEAGMLLMGLLLFRWRRGRSIIAFAALPAACM